MNAVTLTDRSLDLPRLRDRLELTHAPKYHRKLCSQVLEFLYSRQMRPKEAA